MTEIITLANGLTLIVEEIPHVESAAYDLFIPGGVIYDEKDLQGSSLILAELTSRGAGGYDSRALSDAFDALGIRHSESAGQDRFLYRGTLLAENLPEALRYVALMVQEPILPESEVDNIRSILLQDLKALEDNPAAKSVVELAKCYYPGPYGRSTAGTVEGLEASNIAKIGAQWRKHYKPNGAVLSVAGNVKIGEVREVVEALFGTWKGESIDRPEFGPMPKHAAHYVEHDSAQLQIALAYPSAKFGDSCYYPAKITTGILSGGMFGRLFIEVREKRGLCYHVYASHSSTQNYGTVLVYAGTTPERAHETLEVVVSELKMLSSSVQEEELSRAKANLLSSLIIGEESTSSRAYSNAADWWIDKRVRTLDEIKQGITSVSRTSVQDYLSEFPSDSFMLLTLGTRRLDLPEV